MYHPATGPNATESSNLWAETIETKSKDSSIFGNVNRKLTEIVAVCNMELFSFYFLLGLLIVL